MAIKTFLVPNISCGHCVHTIQSEVKELAGVTSVVADQQTKMVTVEWNEPPMTWQKIKEFLVEIDYAPEN